MSQTIDIISEENRVICQDLKDMKQDHNVISQRLTDYDKRAHQLQEYVRSSCDKSVILTKEDIETIMIGVDEKMYTLTNKVDNFADKLIQVDSRVIRNEEACLDTAKPILCKVELAVMQMKDHLQTEMTSIQKKLGADYELHWTKYQDLVLSLNSMKAKDEENSIFLKGIDGRLGIFHTQIEGFKENDEHNANQIDKFLKKFDTFNDSMIKKFDHFKEEVNETLKARIL